MKKAVTRAWEAVEIYIQALSFLLAAFCIFGGMAHTANAQTPLSEAQIQAITNLTASLGAPEDMVASVDAALHGTVLPPAAHKEKLASTTQGVLEHKPSLPPAAAACAALTRTLKRGAVGEDVTKLQEFLKTTGDFTEASTSTFFGPATERALQMWQARMQIATSGDPGSTGFGALGPLTRAVLAKACAHVDPADAAGNTSGGVGQAPAAPTCTLSPSQNPVASGTSVTITWESQHATYAGSATGEKMPANGTVIVTPSQTTLYVKHVYGPGGEGSCQTTVTVSGAQATPQVQMVLGNMSGYLGHLLGSMQLGAVVVAETFGFESGQ